MILQGGSLWYRRHYYYHCNTAAGFRHSVLYTALYMNFPPPTTATTTTSLYYLLLSCYSSPSLTPTPYPLSRPFPNAYLLHNSHRDNVLSISTREQREA